MTNARNPSSFIGEIPTHYDTGLGPNIFQGYAADLATRVAALAPERVLELAAGTGILTRCLCDLLADAELVATDLNQPMLDFAARKFGPNEKVSFRVVDATQIEEPPGSFDVIACQFGVMFFPDKGQSFREARKVLRRGGHYLFNVWGPVAANPFARIAYDTPAALIPDDPPQFYKTPFSYNDAEHITSELTTAGFQRVEWRRVALDAPIHSIRGFATGIVYGNPVVHEFARGQVAPETVVTALEAALEREFGPDPARMPLEAIVFDATA